MRQKKMNKIKIKKKNKNKSIGRMIKVNYFSVRSTFVFVYSRD